MKDIKANFKVIDDWTGLPPRFGIPIHNPLFRDMQPEEIIEEANLAEYVELGYRSFTYCKATATVHVIENGIQQRIKNIRQ